MVRVCTRGTSVEMVLAGHGVAHREIIDPDFAHPRMGRYAKSAASADRNHWKVHLTHRAPTRLPFSTRFDGFKPTRRCSFDETGVACFTP